MTDTLDYMTPENTQSLTLHNPVNGHEESKLIGIGDVAIDWAVACFASDQRIPPCLVETSTRLFEVSGI